MSAAPSKKKTAEGAGWPAVMDGFPDRVEHARKRLKMTQSRLAELAGVDAGTLSKIVNGKREGATMRFLTSLARVLEVSPGWLLFGEGPLPEARPPRAGDADRRKSETKLP